MFALTLGEGGHTEAFLKRYLDLDIIGVDADADILTIANNRLAVFGNRIEIVHSWSNDFLKEYGPAVIASENPGGGMLKSFTRFGAKRPATILLDLGVSMFHDYEGRRGFSYTGLDEALDMRLAPGAGNSASDLLRTLKENEIADLLFYNAGERYAYRIAKAIVRERQTGCITRVGELAELVWRCYPAKERHKRIHPATKTFAALRIAVNGELEKLPGLLRNAFELLDFGGRLGVITFHSAEDKIVKEYFRGLKDGALKDGVFEKGEAVLVTKKPVAPSEDEIVNNGASRSAKLRVIEKVNKVNIE
jgi:16S rRNA (cytosine1402-N4)-methyltransferase